MSNCADDRRRYLANGNIDGENVLPTLSCCHLDEESVSSNLTLPPSSVKHNYVLVTCNATVFSALLMRLVIADVC